MSFIEQSIQGATAPSDRDVDVHVERGRDLADLSEGHPIQLAALGARDPLLGDARTSRDAALTPTQTLANRP